MASHGGRLRWCQQLWMPSDHVKMLALYLNIETSTILTVSLELFVTHAHSACMRERSSLSIFRALLRP